MALLRRLSIRRVVVSAFAGVVMATSADVIGRAVWQFNSIQDSPLHGVPWTIESTVAISPSQALYVYGTGSPLRDSVDAGLYYPRDFDMEPASSDDGTPSWMYAIAAPYREQVVDRRLTVHAHGLPVRSTVLEWMEFAYPANAPPRLTWMSGDIWFVTFGPAETMAHRLRVLPALLNIACFTLLAWTALAGFTAARGWRRRAHGMCQTCGYALTAAMVCPECGAAAPLTRGGRSQLKTERTERPC